MLASSRVFVAGAGAALWPLRVVSVCLSAYLPIACLPIACLPSPRRPVLLKRLRRICQTCGAQLNPTCSDWELYLVHGSACGAQRNPTCSDWAITAEQKWRVLICGRGSLNRQPMRMNICTAL